MEIGMTVDAVRAGYRLREYELDLEHRATGRDARRLPPPRRPAARLRPRLRRACGAERCDGHTGCGQGSPGARWRARRGYRAASPSNRCSRRLRGAARRPSRYGRHEATGLHGRPPGGVLRPVPPGGAQGRGVDYTLARFVLTLPYIVLYRVPPTGRENVPRRRRRPRPQPLQPGRPLLRRRLLRRKIRFMAKSQLFGPPVLTSIFSTAASSRSAAATATRRR